MWVKTWANAYVNAEIAPLYYVVIVVVVVMLKEERVAIKAI